MKKVISILLLLLLSGCGGKEVIVQTVYRDVYTPVPCAVPEPEKPAPQENAVLAVIELKSYADGLLAAFRACKGE